LLGAIDRVLLMAGSSPATHGSLCEHSTVLGINVAAGSAVRAVRSLRYRRPSQTEQLPVSDSSVPSPANCGQCSTCSEDCRHLLVPTKPTATRWAPSSIKAGFNRKLRDFIWCARGKASRYQGLDLDVLAHQHQPALVLIAEYLATTPQHISRFCETAPCIAKSVTFMHGKIWSRLLEQRWPAFHASLVVSDRQDWRALYQQTLKGTHSCILEVFHREKKMGFSMSAMPANVWYNVGRNSYIVKYISAAKVTEEVIPHKEGHRLRSCPSSVVDELTELQILGTCSSPIGELYRETYHYRVLSGTEGLVIGRGVELQWRMQCRSPFGWWYGRLESLDRNPDSSCSTATVVFDHFSPTSKYHRIRVSFGDGEVHEGMFGGFTGGIRPISSEEERLWMRFFPPRILEPLLC